MQPSNSLVLGEEPVRARATVPVYFCGGTGANIAVASSLLFETLHARDRSNMAQHVFNLVDTSRSNLTAQHKGMNFWHMQKDGVHMDGGGKVMKDVFSVAKHQAPDILKAMPPGNTNIVVCSLGGGSGNSLGIALAQELRRQGKEVLIMGIVNTESKSVLENVTRSMALLKDSVAKLQKTIVLAPFKCDSTKDYHQINQLVAQTVAMTLTLLSNQNARMDTADITQWLNFEHRMRCEPALVGLYYTVAQEPLPDQLVPLTVATLTNVDNEDASTGWATTYQTHGILPNPPQEGELEASSVFSKTPAHFTICDGVLQQIFDLADGRTKEISRAVENRGRPAAFDSASVDLDGMEA